MLALVIEEGKCQMSRSASVQAADALRLGINKDRNVLDAKLYLLESLWELINKLRLHGVACNGGCHGCWEWVSRWIDGSMDRGEENASERKIWLDGGNYGL
jgi:hypothetical protein